jgi:chemotaxis protein CheD
MGKLVVVGIADQQVTAPPEILITYALGSCVGVCLYDKIRRVGGLAHIFMPKASGTVKGKELHKFADTAIEEMVKTMQKKGCNASGLTAKIAGGASMFGFKGICVGEQNIEIVKRELRRFNIKLLAEDTGSNYGRTVEFNLENGTMTVKTAGKGNKVF